MALDIETMRAIAITATTIPLTGIALIAANVEEYQQTRAWLKQHYGLPSDSEWWKKYCHERPFLNRYLGSIGRWKAYRNHFANLPLPKGR